MTHKNKNKGFVFVELIVTITVLGFILSAFTVSLITFIRFNHYQLTRQQCTSAAQAQIESITFSGSELDDELLQRLWPKVSTTIEKTPGTKQWQDLVLVEVKAEAKSFNRDVVIEISRYIKGEI
ncbi:MAG: type IV pilus modification PilV family protein [Planctomycetota bacterium]